MEDTEREREKRPARIYHFPPLGNKCSVWGAGIGHKRQSLMIGLGRQLMQKFEDSGPNYPHLMVSKYGRLMLAYWAVVSGLFVFYRLVIKCQYFAWKGLIKVSGKHITVPNKL